MTLPAAEKTMLQIPKRCRRSKAHDDFEDFEVKGSLLIPYAR
jgi:hypothetical protein